MPYFIIVFLIGLLILVHDWGHLLAARWVKIPIARVFQLNETLYFAEEAQTCQSPLNRQS